MAAEKHRDDPQHRAPSSGLVDRFLAPELLTGPSDLLRRARLAIAFAWVCAGFFLVAAASQFRADNGGAALFDAFGALVTLASPMLVRRTGQVVVITHAVLALVFGAVLALSVLVRGAGLTGGSLMLAVIPCSRR